VILARLALGAILACQVPPALADKYGIEEALRDGSDGAGAPVLLWSMLAGACLGYMFGRMASKRDSSRDPQGYAVLGALFGGPLIALLWALG
jgi:hypothetical protein